MRRWFYETVEINRIAETTLVFSKPLLFYTIDSNLYKKISPRRFYRKVSTVTPIETKGGVTETGIHSIGLIRLA